MYEALKDIHRVTAVITITLFCLRGVWMLTGSAMLQRRWVRIVPHVNDTVLLASALALAIGFHGYPMVHQGWITAKILALLGYIGLGTVALKRGRSRRARSAAFAGAVVVFAYIAHTALTRSLWPW